jgi:outer membrane receptor protein involved in Fe transport
MSKKLFRDTLLASTVIAGMAMFTTPAFAQDANDPARQTPPPGTQGTPAPADEDTPGPGVIPQDGAGAAEETSSGDIVVTGTLIKNPNLTASNPVTVIGQEEIQLRQTNVAEEVLREIPGAVPSIGSQVNNGSGGAAFVNLRGLGSNRNLVLLDGVRITPAGLGGQVDLNNIPLALIDRVDALTGGASTTYGADAVAGVVNFITRSDFAGAEISASQTITEQGDGNQFRVDVTVGANFDDGRGNAVLNLGYIDTDPVYFGDRTFARNGIESYLATAPGGSGTTVPARFSFQGGGLAVGTPGRLSGNQQIDPQIGAVPVGSVNGGQGTYAPFNFNPFNVFQTPFQRFNMYGAGHYEVTDGLEVYTRGLFSNNTVETIIAPSGLFATQVTVPVSNPFLTPALRTQFCANQDFNPTMAGIQPLTPEQCAAAAVATSPTDPNFRTFLTNVGRRTPETGSRVSEYETTIFDFRTGIRGGITDTINFDVFGAYGQSQNTQTIQGYVLTSRARAAVFATNPNTCLGGAPLGGSNAPGCVPLNLFGAQGSITPQMANFLVAESTTTINTSLAQARALINGDFGITSPFGTDPIGFAVGAEYRKYQADQRADLLAQTPGELGGAGGAAPNIDGGLDVYEGFAELIAPLVQDRPFFESLLLEAGVRRSRYKVFAPGSPKFRTTTYKVGGQWMPVQDIKFRGNYSRAVRAPNISELFSPQSVGLTNLGTDPCAGAAPVNNATLRAVCLAQGAPADQIGSIENPTAGQANAVFGGNLNLKPETSDSYTVGAVFQPTFVQNLAITIDYFNIDIKGAVSTPTPQDVISACFGSLNAGSAQDPACTGIRRNPTTGSLAGDPSTTLGLPIPLSNAGRIKTDGVDLGANYRTDLPFLEDAKLSLTFQGTWTRNSEFQASPSSINRECVGFFSVNCGSPQPKYRFSQRTTLTLGDIDVSLLWRYMHKLKLEPLQLEEDIAAAQAPGSGCPDPLGADPSGCVIDPQFRNISSRHYFDLTTRFGVMENFDLTVTVANLFDKSPPIVGNSVGTTTFNGGNTFPSSYDPLGRRFTVGARLKF